ncbi:phosphotransferase family protein [Glaciibacter flavus]|uniref:phosphotransferase family protein n=1 Tax=Orlajensenia flava TaxID=2565934 RepID=UPI003AFFE0E5
MEEVQIVVAHSQRATLRVGDVFLKVDRDPAHADIEVRAMALAPVPTPAILWCEPPVLAIAAVPGTALGLLGEPSSASPAAWAAAGAAIRSLHEAPVPPWPGRSLDDVTAELDRECEWLLANQVLPTEVIRRNREIAEVALRPWKPVFIHGDLRIPHVFVDGDELTGVIDWSEAAPGDAMFDLVDPRPRGMPRRSPYRLRFRRGSGRDPRLVVTAEPRRVALADRTRLQSG